MNCINTQMFESKMLLSVNLLWGLISQLKKNLLIQFLWIYMNFYEFKYLNKNTCITNYCRNFRIPLVVYSEFYLYVNVFQGCPVWGFSSITCRKVFLFMCIKFISCLLISEDGFNVVSCKLNYSSFYSVILH